MLKNVRKRRNDALSQVTWQVLETLLAVHYRGQGYAVEHVGTGGSGSRYDGGIDLKLRRGDEYVIVECKHWNARQVPHNVVHQLLGIMVNEGATGAIVVSSGEFTEKAKEAAARRGEVQLIDGDALRAMLGPLPPSDRVPAPAPGWRNVDPAEMRSWRSGRQASLRRTLAGIGIVLLVVLGLFVVLRTAIGNRQSEILRREALAAQAIEASKPKRPPRFVPQPRPAVIPTPPPAAAPPPKIQLGMTEEEKAEWNRKNAESMKIIEKTTPEM